MSANTTRAKATIEIHVTTKPGRWRDRWYVVARVTVSGKLVHEVEVRVPMAPWRTSATESALLRSVGQAEDRAKKIFAEWDALQRAGVASVTR